MLILSSWALMYGAQCGTGILRQCKDLIAKLRFVMSSVRPLFLHIAAQLLMCAAMDCAELEQLGPDALHML